MKGIIKKTIAGIIAASIILTCNFTVHAETKITASTYSEPTLIRCTCYTAKEGAITASGQPVREGIIAGKSEWCNKGYFAILYDKDMNLIGIYEFLDTGAGIDTDGDGKGDSIKSGKSVDVFRSSLSGCREWVKTYGDYVYIQIIQAEG